MTIASDNPFPSILMVEGDPEALADDAAAGQRRLAVGTDHLLYLVDDTGTKTQVGGGSGENVATSTIWDAAGDLVQGTGANTGAKLTIGAANTILTSSGSAAQWSTRNTGYRTIVMPDGMSIGHGGVSSTPSTNATAQIARSCPIWIPGRMQVRSCWINVSASAAGTVNWGLFDMGSTLTAATMAASGAAALGSTAWQEIAATSAPVAITQPGQYMLIIMLPAATPPTLFTYGIQTSVTFIRAWSTYTWDTTPDLTSGSWSSSSVMFEAYLEGDMDASNTRL